MSSLRNIIDVGNSFIFNRNYCTVTRKNYKSFSYDIQGSDVKGFMTYDFYATTPTYKSRNSVRNSANHKFNINIELIYNRIFNIIQKRIN